MREALRAIRRLAEADSGPSGDELRERLGRIDAAAREALGVTTEG